LMMSSADIRYDQALFREMGIADYVTKPVSQSDLLNAIIRLLSTKTASADDVANAQEDNKSRGPVKGLHILLTEDNAVNQYVAMSFLMEAGHKVKIANNGKEALAALEKEEFDLILMDVQMPEMDGFEATAAIREEEKTSGRHIPIVAMTALAMKGDRERCLAAGMDNYVSKPINRDELFRAIETVASFSPQASRRGDELQVAREDENPKPVFDEQAALARLQGNRKLLKEIAGMFLTELPQHMAAIREAIDQADSHKLDRAGHTLKGAVGNFCANSARDAAFALEKIGKSGDLTGAAEAYGVLQQELERLLPVLKGIAKENTE